MLRRCAQKYESANVKSRCRRVKCNVATVAVREYHVEIASSGVVMRPPMKFFRATSLSANVVPALPTEVVGEAREQVARDVGT
jgi:hypothetical protein